MCARQIAGVTRASFHSHEYLVRERNKTHLAWLERFFRCVGIFAACNVCSCCYESYNGSYCNQTLNLFLFSFILRSS
jgi:hypothetical protein